MVRYSSLSKPVIAFNIISFVTKLPMQRTLCQAFCHSNPVESKSNGLQSVFYALKLNGHLKQLVSSVKLKEKLIF